uniref:NADH-ubiquinone oxidoreductase chain 4L n=1 Tax=Complanledra complana TaxID=3078487 RepID=A0AAU6PBW7_9HEMI
MKLITIYVFLISMTSFLLMRKHTLMSLLSLEFMMMSNLIMIMMLCLMMKFSLYLFLFMMTMLICEGVLGLSVLVNMIRCHGNDFMNSPTLW